MKNQTVVHATPWQMPQHLYDDGIGYIAESLPEMRTAEKGAMVGVKLTHFRPNDFDDGFSEIEFSFIAVEKGCYATINNISGKDRATCKVIEAYARGNMLKSWRAYQGIEPRSQTVETLVFHDFTIANHFPSVLEEPYPCGSHRIWLMPHQTSDFAALQRTHANMQACIDELQDVHDSLQLMEIVMPQARDFLADPRWVHATAAVP